MLHTWLDRAAAVGMRVTFQEQRRSDAQNRLMWPYLTAISQQLEWHGQKYTPDDWKDYLMHQLGRGRWMPAEQGGMVPIGMRTSDLSKAEFGDLITVIQEFAARHDVMLGDEEQAVAA
jgi:hypothetical protein